MFECVSELKATLVVEKEKNILNIDNCRRKMIKNYLNIFF